MKEFSIQIRRHLVFGVGEKFIACVAIDGGEKIGPLIFVAVHAKIWNSSLPGSFVLFERVKRVS
jgi:hypothetical protein